MSFGIKKSSINHKKWFAMQILSVTTIMPFYEQKSANFCNVCRKWHKDNRFKTSMNR